MKQLFAIVALASAFMVPANNVAWAANSVHPAQELIQTSIEAVLGAVSTDSTNTDQIIKQYVVPHFDFYKMSYWVLGRKKWKAASSSQRKRFAEAFESLLIRTYKTALKEAAGKKFEIDYQPVRARPGDKRVRVRTQVIQGSQKTRVEYNMYKNRKGHWMAYNVYVEGISLLLNYRNEFKRDSIEAAIAKLNSKNQNAT